MFYYNIYLHNYLLIHKHLPKNKKNKITGSHSCFAATIIENTNGGSIKCFGSYSCYKSNLIQIIDGEVLQAIQCW